jgi:hypothetical protein
MLSFCKPGLTLRAAVFCLCAVITAMPAFAGTWSSQVVLGTNAYSGSVTLDAAGNMTAVWYQAQLPNGTAVNQIWASTAPFGHAWSTPINISGNIGVASGNPLVRGSASGNVTAIYTSPTLGGTFVDHPAGGSWGTPGSTNGVNQFYVSNDNGDQGLAWGAGATRVGAGVTSIVVVQRPAGGSWSQPTTIVTGAHLNLDGTIVTPNGSMAVVWESFNAVCGSRVCNTSNWVLHVSSRAPGGQWIDSGALLGPDAKQHFGQLAADGLGNLGVVSVSAGNIVSLVRHGSSWTAPAVVVSTTNLVGLSSGSATQNRVYASDSSGHATVVGWGNAQLTNLVAVDGNLTTNTWGKVTTISGSDQNPNYFDFAMSSSGTAIAFWSVAGSGSNTTWRAATRSGFGVPWNTPATAGTSFDGGGVPEGVAINSAGRAAVVFHGYSSDFLTFIEYTNTYQP